jgi:VWFA-related protein
MHLRVCFGLALFAFVLQGDVTMAQLNAPQSHPASHTISLNVMVTGAGGSLVGGLTQQDFTVLDKKIPRPAITFEEMVKKPAEVLVVIDAVNTPTTAVAYQRDQIVKFLRSNGGRLAHPTSFAVLTDRNVQTFNGTSTDGNALADALEHYEIGLRDIRRSSGIYGGEDQLAISLTALRNIIAYQAKLPGRKLVLWVSPGWPLLSGPGVEVSRKQEQQIFENVVDLSTQLREADITLYAVDTWGVGESLGRVSYYQDFLKGVSKPEQVQLGNLGLQVLAVQSGGLALNSNGATEMLQRCEADADDYYRITFEPAPSEQPNEYHPLEIRVAKPGLTVRASQGYYSQP